MPCGENQPSSAWCYLTSHPKSYDYHKWANLSVYSIILVQVLVIVVHATIIGRFYLFTFI